MSALEIPLNSHTFVGRYGGFKDWDTGLINFWHRWYDSEIGRWISKDPIGIRGGINLYGYVVNNSVNIWDANGLQVIDVDKCIDVLLNQIFAAIVPFLSYNIDTDEYKPSIDFSDITQTGSLSLTAISKGIKNNPAATVGKVKNFVKIAGEFFGIASTALTLVEIEDAMFRYAYCLNGWEYE